MTEPLLLTRDQSRRVDQIAVERFGIPSIILMENAGRGVVDVLLALDPDLVAKPGGEEHWRHASATQGSPVAILCGQGNNAGDGFVIARHLAIRGIPAATVLLSPPDKLSGDARINYEILIRSGLPVVDLSASGSDLEARLEHHAGGATWLVDALLGTGARGAPRPPLAEAIRWMNAQPARRLAIDLPSGLDCDTGEPAEPTVRADVTCTFVARKTGFAAPQAAAVLGEVHVVSIGVPASVAEVVQGG